MRFNSYIFSVKSHINSTWKLIFESLEIMSDINCKFCWNDSFEIHDGATFCMNCGNESEEHGQDLVYEIPDMIEDTESEEDDENLDYPDEEENNELSEDSDEFYSAESEIDDENLDYPNHGTDEEENNEFSEDSDLSR